jgi:oleandomycin transport system ATP-binding protein
VRSDLNDRAVGVVKRFGKTVALDGLDLAAGQGMIRAVLGPNGASKTTFVRCVATLIQPDAGTLHVFVDAHTTDRGSRGNATGRVT